MQKKNKLKPFILGVLSVICIAALAVSLYNALTIYIPQKQEQRRFHELQQIAEQKKEYSAEKYLPFFEMNTDFRGWLKIEDTDISYPVVKPTDEDAEYYLHRDFDKNYSFSGTPFIGAGADENSDIFIIYAHNMKTDTMFGRLDDYADSDWAKAHRDIVFDTLSEHRVYRVFAAFQTKVGAENEYRYYEKAGSCNTDGYNKIISEIAEKSLIDTYDVPSEKSQIIMLSTCSYHTKNGRFVVAAYRTE